MNKITAQIDLNGEFFSADLNNPIDISLELSSEENARAWYVDLPQIEPVMTEHFTGSVELGGAVNFRNIFFNPHGHGTHTECVGHISKEIHSINDSIKRFFSVATLLTVSPEVLEADDRWMKKGDSIISKAQLEKLWDARDTEALIIRTAPNADSKRTLNYSDTNPAYLHPEAMEFIAKSNVRHLLLDLPSVDRESDQGLLTAHKIYWGYPENINHERTITEMIFVANDVSDGLYLLELQVAPFRNDASPSRPVLYSLASS